MIERLKAAMRALKSPEPVQAPKAGPFNATAAAKDFLVQMARESGDVAGALHWLVLVQAGVIEELVEVDRWPNVHAFIVRDLGHILQTEENMRKGATLN